MEIRYRTKKVEKQCSDFKLAKREFGNDVAIRLYAMLTYIAAAKNLLDIKNYAPAHLHPLKGKRSGEYSIYLGKNTGYRLVIIPINENEELVRISNENDYVDIVIIRVEEISKHYE